MQFAVYIEGIFQLTRAHSTRQIQREPKLSPEVPYVEETEEYSILKYYFNAISLTINTYYSKRWLKKNNIKKPKPPELKMKKTREKQQQKNLWIASTTVAFLLNTQG